MSRRQRSGLLGGAVLAALASALGCQSLADIPDVSFSPICKQYCDAVFEACTGGNEQYPDERTCLEVCVLLDQNAKGSRQGVGNNTVQCRIEFVKNALISTSSSDTSEFCGNAGPGGGQKCTDLRNAPADCQGYCALFELACGGKTANLYASLPVPFGEDTTGTQAQCVEKCRAIPPAEGGYNWQSGKDSGDSLGCRLYYVSKAASDPAENCQSAGIRPAGPCQVPSHEPVCSNFCLTLSTACKDTKEKKLSVYESIEQCEGVCAIMEPGSTDTPDFVDTVGCRNSHAFNALLVSAADHCPHSGPLGSQVCAENGACQAYCYLAKKACSDEFDANFEGQDDCLEKCLKLEGATGDKAGTYSVEQADKGGNNLQCRGLAVSRALDESDPDRAEKCPGVFGAAPCAD